MFITVVGGGNSTTIFATLAIEAGHTVAILTRRPKDWATTIGFVNDDLKWDSRTKITGSPHLITANEAECIPQSDVVFIAGIPVHHNPEILKRIKPHIGSGKKVFIGSVCAYGGFNWVCERHLGAAGNYVLFGTNLIPWTCGTDKYGETGHIFGVKRVLRCVTEGGVDAGGVKAWLGPILRQPLVDCDFLSSTLWPNNPSLHPPILYGLFKDWDGVTPYKKTEVPSKIYADLTPESAKCVCDLDRDLVSIVKSLSIKFPTNKSLQHDFSLKACILENYEDQVTDPSTTVTCVSKNIAFASHYLQYKEVGEGLVVPLVDHKFFITDLPYGLCTYKDIALSLGLATPCIDAIIYWNQKMLGKDFLVDNELKGKDIGECIIPSQWGYSLQDMADQTKDRSSTVKPGEEDAEIKRLLNQIDALKMENSKLKAQQ